MPTTLFRSSLFRSCGALFTLPLLGFVICGQAEDAAKTSAKPVPVPKITVSKETTYFTQPLNDDGVVLFLRALNDHFGRGITSETNAIVPLYRAMGPAPEGTSQPEEFFRLAGIAPLPAAGKYFVELAVWCKERNQNVLPETHDQAMNRPWKQTEFPEIAAWLQAMDEPLQQVVEASRRPDYFSPLVSKEGDDGSLITVLLPGVQKSRSLARALLMRAMERLGQGETSKAWDDLLAVHRLGRLIGRGPTLIEWLVGAALESMAIDAELRLISETKPNPQLIVEYSKQLAALPNRAAVADKIDVCERTMFLDCCIKIGRGRMTLSDLTELGRGEKESLFSKVLHGVVAQSVEWDDVLKSGNRWYDRMAAGVRIADYREQTTVLRKLDQELQEIAARRTKTAPLALIGGKPAVTQFASDVLIGLLLPAVRAAASAEHRLIQRERNLTVALALAAWHSEQGSYPAKLSELVPSRLAADPLDLFDGLPLRYRRETDGYLLYSIGANEKDDAGRSYEDEPRGDDLPVRMPKRSPMP